MMKKYKQVNSKVDTRVPHQKNALYNLYSAVQHWNKWRRNYWKSTALNQSIMRYIWQHMTKTIAWWTIWDNTSTKKLHDDIYTTVQHWNKVIGELITTYGTTPKNTLQRMQNKVHLNKWQIYFMLTLTGFNSNSLLTFI